MNPATRRLCGIALFLACICLAACSAPTAEEVAQKILGQCQKDDDSGAYVLSVIQQDSELMAHYRFFPLGFGAVEEEMGIHLSGKIERLYEEIKSLDTAKLVVYLPFIDKLGNVTWEKTAQFTFTRDLYNKINWKNFYGADLFDVVKTTWYID